MGRVADALRSLAHNIDENVSLQLLPASGYASVHRTVLRRAAMEDSAWLLSLIHI